MSADRIIDGEDGQPLIARSLLDELQGIRRDLASGLSKVTTRIDGFERRLSSLETWRHDKDVSSGVHQSRDAEVFTRRQKVWGAIGAIAVVCATVVGPVIATLVGH